MDKQSCAEDEQNELLREKIDNLLWNSVLFTASLVETSVFQPVCCHVLGIGKVLIIQGGNILLLS